MPGDCGKLLGANAAFPIPLVVAVKDPGKAFEDVRIVVKLDDPPGDRDVPFGPPMTRKALLFSVVFLTQLVGADVFLKMVTEGFEGVSAEPPRKLGIELQPDKVSEPKIAICFSP